MGDAAKFYILALGKGIADLDGAVIVQADDIPRDRLRYGAAITGHKRHRISDFHILANAHMAHLHALFIDARAHAHKGNAVPVAWVHVGLDFEHKTGKLLLACFHKSLFSGASQRGRRPLNKVVEHLSHTKVAQRCAEKYRRHTPRQVGVQIELWGGAPNKLHLLLYRLEVAAQQLSRLIAVPALDAHIV